jgi:predicted HD phosphohydrolase
MTKPIVQELQDFTSGATAFFYNHHTCDNSLLRRFLSSTMDEARLSFADRYAAQVLMKYDLDDWVHFRQGVHRREVGGNISYAAQRDHSAHTLNNYLLGAYFWEYAPGIRKLIAQHMARRHMLVCDGPYNSQDFFSLWVMASLLHDIGYLFEGAAMPSTTMHSSALNEIGVDVVREYFNSRFWVACRVTAPADRRDLLDFAGVTPFELRHGGFSGILESLRDVGNLIRLQEAINHQSLDTDRPNAIVSDRKVSDQETLITTTPIHDAFTAWSEHYKKFGCPSMVERIQELENYVCKCIYDGLDAQGMRMLDHGACSGLLMLRASTYFFSIWFGLKNADGQYRATNNENLKSAQSRFFAQVPPERD